LRKFKIFEYHGCVPIDVACLLEDNIDEETAEKREAADDLLERGTARAPS